MWNFLFPCGDLSREVSEANDHLLLCLQERTPGGEPGAQSLSTSCLMVGSGEGRSWTIHYIVSNFV